MNGLPPPYIIKALGEFDLDPCSPEYRPFETAKSYYTKADDGLSQEWNGRVWCNPPYGEHTEEWLARCASHKNCTVLIFARTETQMFFRYIWGKATAIMFIKGRIAFHKPDGTKGQSAGAPSVLIAYDEYNAEMLKNSGIKGHYIHL